MTRFRVRPVILALLMLGAVSPSFAEGPRLRAARVGATDVLATARFYVDALGMKQTRVIERDGAPFEVFLNYGETVEAAAETRMPKLLILLRKPGEGEPAVSNLVFGVPDMDVAVKQAIAAGGKVSRPTVRSKTSNARITFVRDPAGNEIELIEE